MSASWQLCRDKRGRLSALRIAALVLLLLPLGKALYDAGAIAHGARPLNDLIHRAGFWALTFLGVTLSITPFRRIARYGNLVEVRRMLGVGAFCYIAAHLCLYIADQGYDLDRRHAAEARRRALAEAAPDRLCHRLIRADPLFSANQGGHHRAGLRRR